MVILPILVIARALRDAGIPVADLSVGDPTDRTTWRVGYPPSATAAQKAQGDALLQTVDPADPTLLAEVKADVAASTTNRDELIALVQALYAAIPSPLLTLAQVRTQFLANLKARL